MPSTRKCDFIFTKCFRRCSHDRDQGDGKTTLARAIFDLISIWFEGKSFVENVREVSKGSLSGLKELQKQILKDVLLSNEEAVCLFSRHAFGREIPVHGYEELSRKVVHYAAGLPLTIKVLGSHLCNRSEPEWVDTIERLKTIPLDKTLKRLELSYNGLENDQKETFLDVVCILKGETKEDAIRILKSCGFNAQIGLSVLEQKSLITISTTYGLGFHDHIEELGWNIVRRMHPNEPNKHSRLWIKEEIEDILVNQSGTEATTSIKLGYSNLHPEIIMKGLIKMKDLRLLDVNGDASRKVDEGRQYLPESLQSLCWHGYPFRSLPNTFQANKLVNRESKISKLWEGGERKVFNKLKFLNLSSSKLRTFDLSMTPHLEALNFETCKNFAELNFPVECPSLKFLNLSRSKVSNLNLGMTPHLESLDIGYCNHFVELYMPVECMNLKVLNLTGCKVSNLNLGRTPYLERLYLKGCSYLQEIHAPVGCLKNLVDFRLNDCLNFEYFMVDKRHRSAVLDSIVTVTINVSCINVCRLHSRLTLPKFWFDFEYDEPRC